MVYPILIENGYIFMLSRSEVEDGHFFLICVFIVYILNQVNKKGDPYPFTYNLKSKKTNNLKSVFTSAPQNADPDGGKFSVSGS